MVKKKKKELNRKDNIVLIYGNQYAVDESVNKIKDQISSDEIIRIDGSDSTLESLSNSLRYGDMFANRKLILVRDFPKGDAKKIIEILSGIPSCNFVIFYSYSSLKAKKTLCKFFSDYAKLIEYDTEIKNMGKIVSQIVKSNNKTLSDGPLELLVEYLGNHVGIVKSEVDKLCNYIGDRKEINIDDIRSICCLNKEFMIWDLIGHVGSRNITKAVESLSASIDAGYSYEFVVLMLMRSIRLGIFLRELDADGLSIWDMTKKIKEYKKENGSFVYGDYEIKKTYDARNGFFASFNLFELHSSLKSCHEAFLLIRKEYKKEEQEKELSMLLFALCFPSSFYLSQGNP